MPRTLARTLPDVVCAVCTRPLIYTGRGRKPVTCTDQSCKREAARRRKAEQRAERRATGRTLTQRKHDLAIADVDAVQLDGRPHRVILQIDPTDPDLYAAGFHVEHAVTPGNTGPHVSPDAWRFLPSDSNRDSAAEWIAANCPDALDDWQVHYRQADTVPSNVCA
jgi:hypothetical protein